ncbi:MAG: glycosyl transferase [Bacteroidota bacterium]|nr:glycosyl transferase [Bacteroidota bacterium]
MKILYAIQGTGNGHLSRAREIIPILQKKGKLDILVSGIQADISIPYDIKYKLNGLSFIFGKSGGVDLFKTFLKCDSTLLVKEIKKLPVEEYDIIINDFEPVSAWACFFKDKPCIALSHQCAVSFPSSPKPEKISLLGKFLLKYYAPATYHYGFHFNCFNNNTYTPVIRKEIRELNPSNLGHYTVYLPSYDDDRLIDVLKKVKNVRWQVFSKHNKRPLKVNNVTIVPIDNEAFIKSMAASEGVLCGAGFETPAEALFLEKKLMVIPMKNQFEQHCNAAALNQLGVPVIKSLRKKYIPLIENWIISPEKVTVAYQDDTEAIIDAIIAQHHPQNIKKENPLSPKRVKV